MTHVRRGIAKLGLLLVAAVVLMAFTAAGTQAVFNVKGVPVAAPLLPEVEGRIEAKTEALLLTTAPSGAALVFDCEELSVTAGNLHPGNVAHATIQVNNATCLTLLGGVDQPNCSGATGINILPIKAIFEAKLHMTGVLILARPLTGGIFTEVHFGGFCSLPLTSIKGTVAFSCTGGCAVSQPVHLLTPVPDALLGDKLEYNGKAATLHGAFEVFLKGMPHVNLPFSAI
jgi:hypothetical protein